MKRNSNNTRIGGGQTLSDLRQSKRLWLSLILSFICAALLCCAFVLPFSGKNENLSVNAASSSFNTTDLKIDTDSIISKYASQSGANYNDYKGSQLSSGRYSASTFTTSDTNITYYENSQSKNGSIAYFEFQVGINVPAWQEYEVSFDVLLGYSFYLAGDRDVTVSCPASIIMAKPDTDDPDFAPKTDFSAVGFYSSGNTPSYGNDIMGAGISVTVGTNKTVTNSLTFSSGNWTLRNESSLEKTYTFNLVLSGGSPACNPSNKYYSRINNLSATLQNTSVKVETLALTTDTTAGVKATSNNETYTGSSIDFDIFYDTTCVDQTSFSCVDRHGNTINSSDYNLSVTNGVGTFSATMAGTYKVTFELNSAATTDGITWWDGDTGAKSLTLTIDPIEVTKMTKPSPQTYDGTAKPFTVNGYDTSIMTAGKKNNAGIFEASLPTGVTAGAGDTFEAVDAGEHIVAFQLPLDSVDGTKNNNYKWEGETSSFVTVDLEVEQRTLEVSWDLLAGLSNWTVPVNQQGALVWNYKNVTDNQPVAGENVKLQYRYYYNEDGTDLASTPADSLDVKDLHDKNGPTSRPQGDYTVYLVIADNTANGGVDGKNYKLGESATLTVTLGAGKADFSQINKLVAIGDALPVDIDGLSGLVYTIEDGTERKVQQVFTVGWDTCDFYATGTDFGGGAYRYEKWDGSAWVSASDTSNAGKYKITVALNIAKNADGTYKDYKFDSALIGTTTANGFKVESVATDGLSATISFEVEIAQKVIDTSDFKLQYSYDQTTWKDFATADNKTEFVDSTIYVRVNPDTMKPSVAGIKAKFGNSDYATGKIKTTYNVTASFTLTDGDNFKISDKSFSWSITNKQIVVDSNSDWEQVDYSFDGTDYIGDLLGIKGHSIYYPSVIEYEYTWYPESDPTDIHTGTGDAAAKAILTTASDTNKLRVTITVKIKSSVTDYELSGGAQTCAEFTVGSDKTPITVTTAEKVTYGDLKDAAGFGVSVTKVSDGSPVAETGLLGEIYAIYLHPYDGLSLDTSVSGSGVLLKDVDFDNLAAGTYVIEVRLSTTAKDNYSLRNGKSLFEVEKKKIALPTVGEVTFKNDFVDLADYLGGSYKEYKDIAQIVLSGTYDGVKNVGTYNVTLIINNGNYCWDYGTGAEPAKATVKYSLADGTVSWTGNDTVAACDWKINPYVLKASGWNMNGKEGAVYNIPAELTEGLDVVINYLYYTDKASNPLGDGEVLSTGTTYFVKAELLGLDSDNFIFEDSQKTTSDFATYKIPKSGAAAALGAIKDFMTRTWLGLPIWAWLLIALAVLILLIIIIAVACKRRKSKEEKAEAKARKEEEKQRREEERRLQQERLEAERELARAKQEAELEKIRMQAQMAGAAGMASMAMQQPQQQPVQQQMPQPVQQPMQQQMPQPQVQYVQSNDNSVLAEIRAELAEIKARQNISAAYQQAAPVQPAVVPAPQQTYAVSAAQPSGGLDEIKMQLAVMRAEQQANKELSAMKTELEMARFASHGYPAYERVQQPAVLPAHREGMSSEILGDALIAAFAKLMANNAPAIEQPPVNTIEENVSQPVQAQYPSDAVITTTTTVDTTQKPVRRERSNANEFSDVDGFYDSIDF